MPVIKKSDKIVLIINSDIPWGGLGQYTINLAQGLSSECFNVFGLVTHSLEGRYDEFASKTINTYFLGSYGKYRRYLEIVRYIWSLRPDYLIINYNAPVHYLLPILPKCTVVSVVHSDDARFYRVAMINKSFVDAWIAPSPKVKQGMLQYGAGNTLEEKIMVIPHGVHPSSLSGSKSKSPVFNIVFIGYLHDYKGVELLPDIFSRFRQICSETESHLTIIGGGDYAERLQQRFENLSLSQYVTLTGVISQKQVREHLANMDVLLFPTWLESFGLVIVESMMEGVVPIVTLLPGVTDTIIEDHVAGYLIEKNFVEGFVSALVDLCRCNSLLSEMSEKCKSVADTKFTLNSMTRNYCVLLNGLDKN